MPEVKEVEKLFRHSLGYVPHFSKSHHPTAETGSKFKDYFDERQTILIDDKAGLDKAAKEIASYNVIGVDLEYHIEVHKDKKEGPKIGFVCLL